MSTSHEENVLAEAKSFFDNAKYSDLTIQCEGKEFMVHQIIICPGSPFFAAACDGDFRVCYSNLSNTNNF